MYTWHVRHEKHRSVLLIKQPQLRQTRENAPQVIHRLCSQLRVRYTVILPPNKCLGEPTA
jgi:hypothetical protein